MTQIARVALRPREYHDSVRLMRLSEALRREPGVLEAMVMMATPNNKKILSAANLLTPEVNAARPDDLVIALTACGDTDADAALAGALAALNDQGTASAQSARVANLDMAVQVQQDSALAIISVPGAYAQTEARRALELGLNVLLFSDNMPLQQERELKLLAGQVDRLMMGPDCGTALIGGACLGFANAVSPGPVGVVGASGTGMQEITSLLDWMGSGVSHAIGTGGRDLTEEIGGLTMLQALDLLASDEGTRVIVVTSKPPAPSVAQKILDRCRKIDKPVVVNFLGDTRHGQDCTITFASTLAQAAQAAARLAGSDMALPCVAPDIARSFVAKARAGRQPGQRFLRGLYAGGTLCYEALLGLRPLLADLHCNLDPGADSAALLHHSKAHTLLDMGDDAFTDGRAHPMIDPYMRNQRILQDAADPETALLLLDLVLGHGAQDDPATELARVLEDACASAAADGRNLPVIVTLCGTAGDIQGFGTQARTLRDAGCLVTRSNAEAVRLTAELIGVTP